ncbi:amidohydrolase [Roseibium sp.]|uniref:amidohydrolase n=1 Tax=Roseibium sp. TaxID=1936156 RepID=UPI003A96B2D4
MDELISLRHWLHAHPEVSRQEVETAKHMWRFLEDHAKPDAFVQLGGAGFAAIYEGKAPGKTVLIRCELDALPIHEVNDDIAYRSLYDGVGHKCGHDGHMTILAGVAQTLADRPQRGRVVLLFQPDEETGSGARSCCQHENFETIQPDHAFALHNLPGFAAGAVICKTGTFASEVKYAGIKMAGKEAHSAQPETGFSPSFALAQLTLKAREIQAKYDRPDAYALVVPVYSQVGVQASGICPGQGEAHFTLRAELGAVVEEMWQELMACATELAEADGLTVSFDIREEFAATTNGQIGFDMIRQATEMTGHAFVAIDQPFRWGEDFGEITKRYGGAMFGLGAGEAQPDLHNPDYDFPDEILKNGISMFSALIEIVTTEVDD